MIYSNIETYYINSIPGSRYIRYDVIKIDEDTFVVKSYDEGDRGMETHVFTRDAYKKEEGIGGVQNSILYDLRISFEGYIHKKCQSHRDSLRK